ncbi:hypothetical protein AV530_003152 [Patagioenas fasciata monilis]|uniref:Uncharacterized protein n=1 Tax=Patagioenas fasciata monilis TaxID=372326 RepID=A0A1V4KW20_PATFA|nr:hypothetical protein AV530_003152 [Patagioenas fasciata monilis]
MEVQERAEALEPTHSPTDTEATLPATRVNPSSLPEHVYPWKPEPTSLLLIISKPPIMKADTNRGCLVHGVCFHG